MAANNLNPRNTWLEIGAERNLSIFSDGKSIVLSPKEVEQVVIWLNQEQKEQWLIVDTTQLELDKLGGLRISKGHTSLFISASETSRALNWLKQHRAS